MKQMLHVFCLFLTITVSSSIFAQSASVVPEKSKTNTSPEVPQGFMCTKVELAASASPEMKKAFMEKNDGQMFYYRFTDAAGVEVAKLDVERLVKEEAIAKAAVSNKLANPNK